MLEGWKEQVWHECAVESMLPGAGHRAVSEHIYRAAHETVEDMLHLGLPFPASGVPSSEESSHLHFVVHAETAERSGFVGEKVGAARTGVAGREAEDRGRDIVHR